MESTGPSLQVMSNEESSWRVFKTLLTFTIMMITLPVGMYFVSKNMVFEGMLGVETSRALIYSAGVAVLMVHIILGLFIYVAWTEGGKPPQEREYKLD
ncbi:vacuolar ATPase assembly integral membrane protein vma21-like [Lingula anatina]|nr:vacuolar ATPase assembly integral membrane protein vma21-like [Lingula anatina]|eukprot:XP_013392266.1 vacuolar ATPase assembly integral membrane protein vma21-like [Lingula anatina]